MSLGEAPFRLVAVSAGTSDPSTTRMLADGATQAVVDRLRESGRNATAEVIELAPIAVDIARALVSGLPVPAVQETIEKLATADGIIVSTPVYKAGISGLFKSFADLLDNDLLIAKPVLLAATAGSARHAMVVDDHLRPLFAFLRTMAVPTSLFAAPEEWGTSELSKRIDRAAGELAALVVSGVGRDIADGGWSGYRHAFAGNATRSERTTTDVDFDTDLMRLARGGH
ncbi:NADH-dependent FMN reductase [Vibrio cholerae]|nr:NADH-dependent FMN reductase [Vibrio cholerae]